MPTCAIVIPCYNEADRLNCDVIRGYLATSPDRRILFVDDGSTDSTLRLLEQLHQEVPAQIRVLHQERNAGKGEAVRVGLLNALGTDAEVVGFWDADLATPLSAIDDLLDVLDSRPGVDIVLGSRVKLLGRTIERRASRHYLGRVFATCASLALGLAVYDTQCGAKLFRAGPYLKKLLERPFLSRWIFDVEILAMYIGLHGGDLEASASRIYEFPLYCWRDVGGSKVRPKDFLRAAIDLFVIRKNFPSFRR